MSHVTALHLAHTPATLTIHAALFTSVRNAPFLRAQLLAGNAAFEYAFIDAASLVSTTHILAAVFRAVTDLLAGRLRTRNVHAEIVFSLSPNNNIAESFRRFGVADGTTALLAVKVGGVGDADAGRFTRESVAAHLTENVQGTLVPFNDEEIARVSDLAGIRKSYKLNAAVNGAGRKQSKGGKAMMLNGHAAGSPAMGSLEDNQAASAPELDERREIEIAALGLMALKGS